MADQVQVLGFTVIAIVVLACLFSLVLIVTALYFHLRDEVLPARRARKRRQALREGVYQERQAARVYRLPSADVERINGKPAA